MKKTRFALKMVAVTSAITLIAAVTALIASRVGLLSSFGGYSKMVFYIALIMSVIIDGVAVVLTLSDWANKSKDS